MKNTDLVGRVASAIPEQRRELDLSLRELERLSGVSRRTLSKIERGGRADPALVVRVAGVLNTLELVSPKDEPPDAVVVDFKREAERQLGDLGRELDRWVVDSLGTIVREGAA